MDPDLAEESLQILGFAHAEASDGFLRVLGCHRYGSHFLLEALDLYGNNYDVNFQVGIIKFINQIFNFLSESLKNLGYGILPLHGVAVAIMTQQYF